MASIVGYLCVAAQAWLSMVYNALADLSDTEDRAALAPRLLQQNATHYNTRLEIVPERFVARLAKLKPQALSWLTDL